MTEVMQKVRFARSGSGNGGRTNPQGSSSGNSTGSTQGGSKNGS